MLSDIKFDDWINMPSTFSILINLRQIILDQKSV
jgi:hypothetical protein